MLMNPQYPPANYHVDMYRGQVHPYSNTDNNCLNSFVTSNAVPEFYGSNSMTGNCYSPNPAPSLDHGLNSTELLTRHNHGYSPYQHPMVVTGADQQPMNMYTSSLPWCNPPAFTEEKRETVIVGQATVQPTGKRKGGRKPKDDPNLSPLEREKRRLRRLRNKEAAAKCRERRLNHTSSLLQQIEQMEKQQRSYEEKIQQLRQHKQKCEELLESHQRDCDKAFSVFTTSTLSEAPVTTCSSSYCQSGNSTPNSTSTVSSISAPVQPQINRRKQLNPKLNLDLSCATSHRLSSSSSGSELHSPMILP